MIICVYDPEVCQRILTLQNNHSLSNEKFCFLTGMSEKLYDDILRNRELNIPYEVMKKMCEIFTCRVEHILHPKLFPL